jgi:formylglycine-generating enzyme required for sulfatase activity
MKTLIVVALIVASWGLSYANPERTFDLPGGATIEMVWIEPGTFTMGSPDSEFGRDSNEGPQHQVTISRGFWLGKYELTQGQWQAVMGSNPSYFPGPNRPVEQVSWNDLQSLIGQLNQAAGNSLYRLPTEAEWEYACRAGATTRWAFGDDEGLVGDYAWYDCNEGCETKEVGQLNPNTWGLYDMHGNVWEQCQDWYENYSNAAQTDPTGPSDETAMLFAHIRRGGGFSSAVRGTRSAYRDFDSPDARINYLGARLLRMEQPPSAVAPTTWSTVKAQAR